MNLSPLGDVQARIFCARLREGAKSAGDVYQVTGICLEAARKELTPPTGLLISHGENAWEDALAAYESRQSGEGKGQ